MASKNLQNFILLAEGLDAEFKADPSKFHPFSTPGETEWFVYEGKSNVSVHVYAGDRDVYIAVDGSGEMYSSYFLTGWHPWHRKTKAYRAAYAKLLNIVQIVNAPRKKSLQDLFPNLAQQKLEEAVWENKDE